MLPTRRVVLIACIVVPSLTSCVGPGDDSGTCADGKCDEDVVSACDAEQKIHDLSGGGATTSLATSLNDTFARMVMRRGGSCPTTFADILTKLKQQVAADPACGESEFEKQLSTRFISETAQLTQMPGRYRTVTTQSCASVNAVIFSLFGVAAGSTELPPNTEIISFDDSAGVFNYYEATGSGIEFFGSSKDLLKGSPDGKTRRCAQCHTGGGLVMKELDTPWLHWEGHQNIPGTDELIAANKDLLGQKSDGIDMEFVVRDGNTRWIAAKLTHLLTKEPRSVKELLKPLFCTVEINIDNGADFARPKPGMQGGQVLTQIPIDSLLDPVFTERIFEGLPVSPTDYDALVKTNEQKMQNRQGQQIGMHIDTIFDYGFIERSAIDNEFVTKLREARIIDADFIKDVLMVDFTRPVFSTERCNLLSFTPEISGELSPPKIRDGFIAKLAAKNPAAGTPEAVLLANLKNKSDSAAHDAKVNGFINACKSLGSAGFLKNALAITSLNRNKARKMTVMEFAETLPFDNQKVDANARLHPTTCALVNALVP